MTSNSPLSVKDIEELAERFAERHLSTYITEIESGKRQFGRKEINDALWGTISLSPVEIALLDSPLIQRLRYIRQLGVVHWVYPSAVHSRFEHTLGVLHQTQSLTSAINNLAAQKGIPALVDANHVALLRLAAILHDVGHAAFSHVSEMALESLPTISPLSAEFSKQFGVESKQLSEIFAFFVAKSRFVLRLIKALSRRYNDSLPHIDSDVEKNARTVCDLISNAIIGKKISDKIPLLHEIISGPFDADKLDYFVRDARFAGTPSVLDISRLIQKISIRQLNATELPTDIAKRVNRIDGPYYIFGIRWSGIAVLDELHLARVLLYAKIYRHPKVISIENMLKSAISSLSRVSSPHALVEFLYRYEDDSLLGMSEGELISRLGLKVKDLSGDNRSLIRAASIILNNIRERRLAVKAFQAQKRYPSDPLEKSTAQSDGLTDFLETIAHPQDGAGFRQRVISEVHTIVGLVDPKNTDLNKKENLEGSIMIHSQGQAPGGSQIARAFLLPSSGEPVSYRQYTVNRTAWVDSYFGDHPAGFVFAMPEVADYVFIALERLLRVEFDIRLPLSAYELGKRDIIAIQLIKLKLKSAGYYQSAPFDIRPEPARLRVADVERRLVDFGTRTAIYQEPQKAMNSADPRSSLNEKAYIWLRQMDTDKNVECGLQILDRFRMINRTDTVDAIKGFVSQNDFFVGSTLVPFGSAKDSGSIQSYFGADLIGSVISAAKTLDEAVRENSDRPIIFIDDFVGSGNQARDILAAGFSMPELRQKLGEERDMFSSATQNFLKSRKIGFVFTAGWDDGVKNIKKTAKELELDAVTYAHIKEDEIPFMSLETFEGIEREDAIEFIRYCEEVGGHLIGSMIDTDAAVEDLLEAKGTREKKMSERALGYGNKAMLLGTPFNIPTQTLTMIWAGGNIRGVEWRPLLSRRKKA